MTKEQVLEETDRGLKIFKFVLFQMSNQHLIVREGRCKNVRNPLYPDSNGSFSVYYNIDTERWCYIDYGDREHRGDPFDIAAHYYNLDVKKDFVELLQRISRDVKEFKPMFNNNVDYSEFKNPDRKRHFKLHEIPFTENAITYLSQFRITTELAQNCGMVQISGYESEKANGEIYYVNAVGNQLMFAYKFPWGAKIYSPSPKDFKYIGNKPSDYVFENSLVGDAGDGEYIILTGGEKDALTLGAIGVPAICLSNEPEPITLDLIKKYYKRGYSIKVMLDCDATGYKKMQDAEDEFSLSTIDLAEIVPTELIAKVTDVSEYISEGLPVDQLINLLNAEEEITEVEITRVTVEKSINEVTGQVGETSIVEIEESQVIVEEKSTDTMMKQVEVEEQEVSIPKNHLIVERKPEISFTTASDLIKEIGNEPEMIFLYRGIPLSRCFGIVAGPSKSGKTILCESLAYYIAGGRSSFLNAELNGGNLRVMLISLEEHYRHRAKRHKKQNQGAKEWSSESVSDKITVVRDGFPNFLNTQDDWDYMRDQIIKSKCKMVIIDSLTRLYRGSIEESVVGQQVCERLRSLAYDLGLILIVIHHTTKQYGKPLTIDSIAGSRILAQEADFAIGVNKTNHGTRYMKELFSRYREESYKSVVFNINSETNLAEFVREADEDEILGSSGIGGSENVNVDIVFDYIKERSSEADEIEHKELMEEFVNTQIMKQVTLQKHLAKLVTEKKIMRLIKGKYKLIKIEE